MDNRGETRFEFPKSVRFEAHGRGSGGYAQSWKGYCRAVTYSHDYVVIEGKSGSIDIIGMGPGTLVRIFSDGVATISKSKGASDLEEDDSEGELPNGTRSS